MSVESIVSPIMEKYGIPRWLWFPAMMVESEGNAKAVTSTGREYSVGLFQINRKAHPEYANLDLTDPAINAEIAARDFLKPGLNIARTITSDQQLQAQIAYSGLKDPSNFSNKSYINGGIKPDWTQDLKSKFLNWYDTAGKPSYSVDDIKSGTSSGTGSAKEDRSLLGYAQDLSLGQSALKWVFVIVIIIIGIISLFFFVGGDIDIKPQTLLNNKIVKAGV